MTDKLEIKIRYLSDMFITREAINSEQFVRELLFYKQDYRLVNTDIKSFDGDAFIKIGAVFSSPHEKDKRMFKPSVTTHYEHHVDYNFFARRIQLLFERLEDYTHIVIDMPPNSDPYTDSIFDLLLNRDKIGSDKVDLLLVSSYDRAHIMANNEWLQSMLENWDLTILY